MDPVSIVIMDGVGAEKFAEHAFNFADKLIREETDNRCYVVKRMCRAWSPPQFMKMIIHKIHLWKSQMRNKLPQLNGMLMNIPT